MVGDAWIKISGLLLFPQKYQHINEIISNEFLFTVQKLAVSQHTSGDMLQSLILKDHQLYQKWVDAATKKMQKYKAANICQVDQGYRLVRQIQVSRKGCQQQELVKLFLIHNISQEQQIVLREKNEDIRNKPDLKTSLPKEQFLNKSQPTAIYKAFASVIQGKTQLQVRQFVGKLIIQNIVTQFGQVSYIRQYDVYVKSRADLKTTLISMLTQMNGLVRRPQPVKKSSLWDRFWQAISIEQTVNPNAILASRPLAEKQINKLAPCLAAKHLLKVQELYKQYQDVKDTLIKEKLLNAQNVLMSSTSKILDQVKKEMKLQKILNTDTNLLQQFNLKMFIQQIKKAGLKSRIGSYSMSDYFYQQNLTNVVKTSLGAINPNVKSDIFSNSYHKLRKAHWYCANNEPEKHCRNQGEQTRSDFAIIDQYNIDHIKSISANNVLIHATFYQVNKKAEFFRKMNCAMIMNKKGSQNSKLWWFFSKYHVIKPILRVQERIYFKWSNVQDYLHEEVTWEIKDDKIVLKGSDTLFLKTYDKGLDMQTAFATTLTPNLNTMWQDIPKYDNQKQFVDEQTVRPILKQLRDQMQAFQLRQIQSKEKYAQDLSAYQIQKKSQEQECQRLEALLNDSKAQVQSATKNMVDCKNEMQKKIDQIQNSADLKAPNYNQELHDKHQKSIDEHTISRNECLQYDVTVQKSYAQISQKIAEMCQLDAQKRRVGLTLSQTQLEQHQQALDQQVMLYSSYALNVQNQKRHQAQIRYGEKSIAQLRQKQKTQQDLLLQTKKNLIKKIGDQAEEKISSQSKLLAILQVESDKINDDLKRVGSAVIIPLPSFKQQQFDRKPYDDRIDAERQRVRQQLQKIQQQKLKREKAQRLAEEMKQLQAKIVKKDSKEDGERKAKRPQHRNNQNPLKQDKDKKFDRNSKTNDRKSKFDSRDPRNTLHRGDSRVKNQNRKLQNEQRQMSVRRLPRTSFLKAPVFQKPQTNSKQQKVAPQEIKPSILKTAKFEQESKSELKPQIKKEAQGKNPVFPKIQEKASKKQESILKVQSKTENSETKPADQGKLVVIQTKKVPLSFTSQEDSQITYIQQDDRSNDSFYDHFMGPDNDYFPTSSQKQKWNSRNDNDYDDYYDQEQDQDYNDQRGRRNNYQRDDSYQQNDNQRYGRQDRNRNNGNYKGNGKSKNKNGDGRKNQKPYTGKGRQMNGKNDKKQKVIPLLPVSEFIKKLNNNSMFDYSASSQSIKGKKCRIIITTEQQCVAWSLFLTHECRSVPDFAKILRQDFQLYTIEEINAISKGERNMQVFQLLMMLMDKLYTLLTGVKTTRNGGWPFNLIGHLTKMRILDQRTVPFSKILQQCDYTCLYAVDQLLHCNAVVGAKKHNLLELFEHINQGIRALQDGVMDPTTKLTMKQIKKQQFKEQMQMKRYSPKKVEQKQKPQETKSNFRSQQKRRNKSQPDMANKEQRLYQKYIRLVGKLQRMLDFSRQRGHITPQDQVSFKQKNDALWKILRAVGDPKLRKKAKQYSIEWQNIKHTIPSIIRKKITDLILNHELVHEQDEREQNLFISALPRMLKAQKHGLAIQLLHTIDYRMSVETLQVLTRKSFFNDTMTTVITPIKSKVLNYGRLQQAVLQVRQGIPQRSMNGGNNSQISKVKFKCGFTPKLQSNLLGLFNKCIKQPTNKKTKRKPPHLCITYGTSKPTVPGNLHQVVRDYLNSQGHGLGNEQFKEAPTMHNGHMVNRFMSNIMQSQTMNQLFTSSTKLEKMLIFGVGASQVREKKYLKNLFSPTFQHMWKINVQNVVVTDQATQLILNGYKTALLQRWNQKAGEPNQRWQDIYYEQLVQDFVNQGFFQDFLPAKIFFSAPRVSMPQIWYYPIRPDNAIECDQGYCLKTQGLYQPGHDTECNIHFEPKFNGKVEECVMQIEPRQAGAKAFFIQTNSHYYTRKSKFPMKGTHLIVGINFLNVPGVHPLPCFQGTYRISADADGKSFVEMNTVGNTTFYKHQLTQVFGCQRTFNMGSVQYFFTICKTDSRSEHIVQRFSIKHNSQKSLFMNRVLKLAETLNQITYSVKIIQQIKSRCVQPQQMSKMMQTIQNSFYKQQWNMKPWKKIQTVYRKTPNGLQWQWKQNDTVHNITGASKRGKVLKMVGKQLQQKNTLSLSKFQQNVLQWVVSHVTDISKLNLTVKQEGIIFTQQTILNQNTMFDQLRKTGSGLFWRKTVYNEHIQNYAVKAYSMRIMNGKTPIQYQMVDKSEFQPILSDKQMGDYILQNELLYATQMTQMDRRQMKQMTKELSIVSIADQINQQVQIRYESQKQKIHFGDLSKVAIDGNRIGNLYMGKQQILQFLQQQLPQTNPPKQGIITGSFKIQQNYYVAKHYEIQKQITTLHASLQIASFSNKWYESSFQKIRDHLSSVGLDSYPQKDGSYRKMHRDAKSIPTGYDVIGKNRTYQMGKCMGNLMYGLSGRLFASQNQPDEQYLKWAEVKMLKFQRFLSQKFTQLYDQIVSHIINSDPIDRICHKVGWNRTKKLKYVQNFVRQAMERYPTKKVYQTFTKSGQVYILQDGQYISTDGFIYDSDNRPRAIQNSNQTGLIQMIQGLFFFFFNKVLKSFIQGQSKKKMQQTVIAALHSVTYENNSYKRHENLLYDDEGNRTIKQHHKSQRVFISGVPWNRHTYQDRNGNRVIYQDIRQKNYDLPVSVSMDGSGFQGNQKHQVRSLLLKSVSPIIYSLARLQFTMWKQRYPVIFVKQVQQYMQIVKFSLMNFDNYAVFYFPGLNLDHNQKTLDALRQSSFHKVDPRDMCVIPFRGTTPSGDALGTTLVNTLLSLMYIFMYLWEMGFDQPYRQEVSQGNFSFMAAGDDTVIWFANTQLAHEFINIVKTRTSSKKKADAGQTTRYVGLGQVIKHDQIKCSTFDDIDFCSKKCFSNGTIDSFKMYRDPKKTLLTKQFYLKRNVEYINNPGLHPLSLLVGYRSQRASRLIEAFFQCRVLRYLNKETKVNELKNLIDTNQDHILHRFQDESQNPDEGYEHEHEIDAELGITIVDLYNLYHSNSILMNGATQPSDSSSDLPEGQQLIQILLQLMLERARSKQRRSKKNKAKLPSKRRVSKRKALRPPRSYKRARKIAETGKIQVWLNLAPIKTVNFESCLTSKEEVSLEQDLEIQPR